MTLYNKKCIGCGSFLNDEKNKLGYTPKYIEGKTKYCYRCFRLKHYNEILNNEDVNNSVEDTIKKINLEKCNVFMVLDVFDLLGSFINIPNDVENLTILVNKMDLLPDDSKWEFVCERIIKNINDLNIKYNKILFTSIKSKTSLQKIEDSIFNANKNGMKSIFIGKSNVGKSSLINGLLKSNKKETTLTINNSMNTTTNLQRIKLNKCEIIDTPGYLSLDNILNYINPKTIKKTYSKKSIKPRTYQIKYPKTLNIENLLKVDIYPIDKCSSTCYFNSELNILTTNIKDNINFNVINKLSYNFKISNDDIKEVIIDSNKLDKDKINISVSGLGMISIKNFSKVKISIFNKVGVNILKYFLI